MPQELKYTKDLRSPHRQCQSGSRGLLRKVLNTVVNLSEYGGARIRLIPRMKTLIASLSLVLAAGVGTVHAQSAVGPGAAIGAIAGAVVGGHNHDNWAPGAIIGGVAGALIGAAVSPQPQQYGYQSAPVYQDPNVVYQPVPVYAPQDQVVYAQPAPQVVYAAPNVVYAPAPVYVESAPRYCAPPGYVSVGYYSGPRYHSAPSYYSGPRYSGGYYGRGYYGGHYRR
jgi:hypothetical protein